MPSLPNHLVNVNQSCNEKEKKKKGAGQEVEKSELWFILGENLKQLYLL